MEELFWDTFMNHMKLYDDAMDFLEHLKKKNKKVLILTDLTAQVQKKKIIKL
jgi:putative hydrolase of the HAD superfamily